MHGQLEFVGEDDCAFMTYAYTKDMKQNKYKVKIKIQQNTFLVTGIIHTLHKSDINTYTGNQSKMFQLPKTCMLLNILTIFTS